MSQITQEFWRADLTQEADRTIARLKLSENTEAVLVPTLGNQIPYHLLMFPETEARSWMSLPLEELKAGLVLARTITSEMHSRKHDSIREFVMSEHGSAQCVSEGSACVSHAHVHLVPLGIKKWELFDMHVAAGGAPSLFGRLDSDEGLSELKAACEGRDYILLSIDFQTAAVWFNTTDFGSQFIRRAAAKCLGADETQTDWRRNPFPARMQLTAESLRTMVAQIIQDTLPGSMSDAALPESPLQLISKLREPVDPTFYANPFIAIDCCDDRQALLEFALSPNEQWAEGAFDRMRIKIRDGAVWPAEFLTKLHTEATRLSTESPSRLVQQAASALARYLQNPAA
jgi:diadenosine tetraphosphate (Ap4A) HIT family hydrolase